eukprot:354704-Chlamydomonas_euryale.AAC.11
MTATGEVRWVGLRGRRHSSGRGTSWERMDVRPSLSCACMRVRAYLAQQHLVWGAPPTPVHASTHVRGTDCVGYLATIRASRHMYGRGRWYGATLHAPAHQHFYRRQHSCVAPHPLNQNLYGRGRWYGATLRAPAHQHFYRRQHTCVAPHPLNQNL